VDDLIKNFTGLEIKKSRVAEFMKEEPRLKFKAVSCHPNARNWREILLKKGTGFLENSVLLDKSGFDINMHRSRGQSSRGKPAINQTASIRANLQTVVGIISASGVVHISMREPRKAQKEKSCRSYKKKST
jgi:hypothetical protein